MKRLDNRNKIVELTRRSVVSSDFSDLEYGETIDVKIVKCDSDGAYFYEDEYEGIITENFDKLNVGDNKEVYLVSSGEFSV